MDILPDNFYALSVFICVRNPGRPTNKRLASSVEAIPIIREAGLIVRGKLFLFRRDFKGFRIMVE